MTPTKPTLDAYLKINAMLFASAAFGFFAWLTWPRTAAYWGFGPISVVMGICCLGMLAKAFHLMAQIRARSMAVGTFVAQARPPEPAKLADLDALRRGGLL